MTTESESAAGERECNCPNRWISSGGGHMCRDTPAEPSAANETDVSRLTEVERVRLFTAAKAEWLPPMGRDPLEHAVERIIREHVRVVEGERDELRAGVENLIRAAEFSANSSLSRDFNGRPGPADVSASSLRALLDGTR